MRNLSAALIMGSSLLLLPAATHASETRGFNSTITSVPASSLRLEVGLSEELSYLAEHSADGQKICTNSTSSRTNGFACGGHFGVKDLNGLTEKIETNTTRALAKKDITVSDEADLVLKVTLVDVKNNRPTQRQIKQQVTLSFQSLQLGGARIEGELFTKDGRSLGTISYSYYESFFDDFSGGRGRWSDANETIQRFSKRLAGDLAQHSQ